MSCRSPLFALKLGVINPETGKEKLKILPHQEGIDFKTLCNRYGEENLLQLPCGKCSSCLESRSKAWAVRCVLEASSYDRNCFITLTYSKEPKCGLVKKDLQKFFKRLRKRYSFRYFACGEYGETTHRAHYHVILFGFFPEDAQMLYQTRQNGTVYRSKILSDVWSLGHVGVADVSYNSCAYVARYTQKKLVKIDENLGKTKEFILMSRKPGLGEKYFRENYSSIYDCDAITHKFGDIYSAIPGKYFDKLFENIDPDKLERLKKERISKAKLSVASAMLLHGFRDIEELNLYRDNIKDAKMNILHRKGV